jgi:hypothetical protein
VIKKRFIDYPDYEELASFYKSFRTTMEQCFKNYPNITPKILEEYRESTGIKAGEIMEAQIKDIEEDIKDAEVFTAFLKMGLETHEMTVEMLKIERDSRQLFLNRMIEG